MPLVKRQKVWGEKATGIETDTNRVGPVCRKNGVRRGKQNDAWKQEETQEWTKGEEK